MAGVPAHHHVVRESLETSSTYDSGSEPLLEKGNVIWKRVPDRRLSIYFLVTQVILLTSSILFFLSGLGQRGITDQQCSAQLSAYSPALGSVEYEYIRFQGTLLDQNPFKGTPSKELDEAWNVIVNKAQIGVNEDDMKPLQKPLTQARYPEEVGGGFTGGLEVFHQLHCLNLIRQYTYKEYYFQGDNIPVSFHDSNHTLRLHLDHCIDIVRQNLQCYGDVGIVTSSWVVGFNDPYPDFSAWHKCRKFEPSMEYTAKHQVDMEITVPEDALVLQKPPCEGADSTAICP